ncbi:MAG: UDP-3-O-acyl-N-acetylglucosamine deacetylase [Fimbriimonas ginsengisoli]|uniref:UDP-3-O-acyl-N-acetylglucosamine deacetylase n=1 Tax=Fimbriimonas ginsengisoli TaxID=1005039 RepID=A0A931LVQ5_FIMGI|nr:UDP-3-O-acyl-N-acetylglucosamine deacetylase [Fimbriimonas ginsengisoli]
MTFERRTIRATVEFEGLGLHSGERVSIRVHPGSVGIGFRQGSERWQATPENVTSTARCTAIGGISTVEHLMAALAGSEVTDVEIEVEGGEVPALDGSAAPFVAAFQRVGFETIGHAEAPDLFQRVFALRDESKIAISKGTGHWRAEYRCEPRWPGAQVFETIDVNSDFPTQIAPARTFAHHDEVAAIRAAGLGLGLDESSALVLGEAGYVNEARFPDEPARHKLLDLIGDLYLAGVPIRLLNVSAARSGHSVNVQAARLLRGQIGA